MATVHLLENWEQWKKFSFRKKMANKNRRRTKETGPVKIPTIAGHKRFDKHSLWWRFVFILICSIGCCFLMIFFVRKFLKKVITSLIHRKGKAIRQQVEHVRKMRHKVQRSIGCFLEEGAITFVCFMSTKIMYIRWVTMDHLNEGRQGTNQRLTKKETWKIMNDHWKQMKTATGQDGVTISNSSTSIGRGCGCVLTLSILLLSNPL